MKVKYLLDTNIISNLLRRNPSPNLIHHMSEIAPTERAICTITLAELLYGALRVPEAQKYILPINQIAKSMQVFAFDEKAARRYAEIRADLTQRGQPIGDAATQVASMALARKLILVTHNVRHFARIPQLTVENWIDQ
jgi:tRNA(fMet)-specific endonuclease VapC